jgi:hypothetical protein
MLRVRASSVFPAPSGPACFEQRTDYTISVLSSNGVTRRKLHLAREIRKPFGVRLLPSVKAAGEKAAKDDSRTLGSLIEKLLVEHLKANGYLPNGKPASKRK